MSETPNKLITLDDIPGMTAERRAAAEAGIRPERGVVSIAAEDFQGDPSRVLGHPSNPTTGAAEALANHLDEIDAARKAANGEQVLRAASPDLIASVPFEDPAEQHLPEQPQQVIAEVPKFDQPR